MSAEFPPVRAPQISRRELIAGLAMISAAGLAAARKPNIKVDYLGDQKLEDILPEKIGRWTFLTNSGLIIPPEDQLSLALYSQLLTRVYYDGNTPIMLLIAYSAKQNGFLQVHRPEFCYTAAGFTLSDFSRQEVALSPNKRFQANTMSATREGGGEKVLYWVRVGDQIPRSWAQQRLVFAEDNLRRLVPDSALIRVSTPLGQEGTKMEHLGQFVREMVAAIVPPMRRVLVA